MSVMADDPPYGCSCKGGQEGCNCAFRDYDTCNTHNDWCQWTGTIPTGCACKSSSPHDCECAMRGSKTASDYDNCVSQQWCEWNGPKPFGCLCQSLGNADCECYFRSGSYDNCVDQKWCEWNAAPSKPQPMSNYVASWHFIGSGTTMTFEAGASWSSSEASEYSTSFTLGMSVTAEVGFEGVGKVSSTVSTSITTSASNTLTKTNGGETKMTCQTPVCDNGNIYQWQLQATDHEDKQWSVKNCNFLCISNSLGVTKYAPKCPVEFCVTSNNINCQCCNGDWSDDAAVNNRLKTVLMGGTCTFPLLDAPTAKPTMPLFFGEVEATIPPSTTTTRVPGQGTVTVSPKATTRPPSTTTTRVPGQGTVTVGPKATTRPPSTTSTRVPGQGTVTLSRKAKVRSCRKAKKGGQAACEKAGCKYSKKYRKQKDKWIVKCKAKNN